MENNEIDLIDCIEFENIEDLIDLLLDRLETVQHEDYESVKLYGNSELIMSAIKLIISSKKYDKLRIGYIDITSFWYDTNINDNYIIEISQDFVVCIQSAFSDGTVLQNEAKFTICMNDCDTSILENIMSEGTSFVVANI